MSAVKSEILEIFLRIREDRNAPYEEDNFIEFLVKPSRRSIDNSFKGLRYKHRFIDEVELVFGVCFPKNSFDKKWNLTDFSAYVGERMQKPGVNHGMAVNKLKECRFESTNPIPYVFLNVVLVPPAFALLTLSQLGWAYLAIPFVYLAIPAAANVLLYRVHAADISHQKALIAKIDAKRETAKIDPSLVG